MNNTWMRTSSKDINTETGMITSSNDIKGGKKRTNAHENNNLN